MARAGGRLRRWFAAPRGVHGAISVAFIAFGLTMLFVLGMQNFSSQHLIEHRYWISLLDAVTADHAARVRAGQGASLPHEGVVRSWYVADADALPSPIPALLVTLPAGSYSTENGYGNFIEVEQAGEHDAFHARVTDLAGGRLLTVIDIEELEEQQNHYARMSTVWVGVILLFIGGVIAWLHANLVRPVRELAGHMQAIEPGTPGARLPTNYKREEIQTIAQASNAHLQRVEQFIARERSLLDQASHEFRTPIAVISGALDLLRQTPLPAASQPALQRIDHAVADLSETMVALLYLAREAPLDATPCDVTALEELLPRVVADHAHLLDGAGRPGDTPPRERATLAIGTIEPTHLAAPEAMVRIAVGNLVRNAIENTEAGRIEVSVRGGVIGVVDSGSGFDPVEAARRYRDSLRSASPLRGQGLGLFLIGRICDRFGWTLAVEAVPRGGTRATLDVSASVIGGDGDD